jgi:hypothetical protein
MNTTGNMVRVPHKHVFKIIMSSDETLSRDISVLTFIAKLHGEAIRGNSQTVLL